MKIRANYPSTPRSHISSFYGVVHHDAKEVERSWKNLCTSHSMEDVLGTPKRNDVETSGAPVETLAAPKEAK